ncbi:erythromycin esterase family protein [Cytophagaceae bacterium DM2B3-1]|uniref:Erythromycin esterase family protein n=1 Tax=Xanthocytophaga flava TaxID=3048013 RepID=A0ABT7CYQ0_9BACT|nr:erythromycin esterase family protein [Xanthocytophaga flavus]MDJ1498901.1 erythromycin esterase family protein [Xanthocytophaga flavus]
MPIKLQYIDNEIIATKVFYFLLFFWLSISTLHAQTVAIEKNNIKLYPILTDAPGSTPDTDLEPLKQAVKNARIVLLGEPTHSEGNIFQLNTRIVEYLHKKCGFDMIAFESGFYDLHYATTHASDKAVYLEGLQKGIYPIWVQSAEFQPMLRFLTENRDHLQVCGFDPQVDQFTVEFLREELESVLGLSESGLEASRLDYLDQVLETMSQQFTVPEEYNSSMFNKLISHYISLLEKVGDKSNTKSNRLNIDFLIQTLTNLHYLAEDYHKNDPSHKTSQSFHASDSNPRDRMMAENIEFLLKKYPNKKIICWGAFPHFANRVDLLADKELADYLPMGKLLKSHYKDQVFTMGVTAAAGQRASVYESVTQLPHSLPGSLEAELSQQKTNYSFLLCQENPVLDTFILSALEYIPLKGRWTQVFDGLLFATTITPSTITSQPYQVEESSTIADVSNREKAIKKVDSLILEQKRIYRIFKPTVSHTTKVFLSGQVKDSQTHQPVIKATIHIGAFVTQTDNQGKFRIEVSQKDTLVITCIGYNPHRQLIHSVISITVELVPKIEQLNQVIVKADRLTPISILTSAIDRLEQNYRNDSFIATYYMQAKGSINKDTVFDIDYVNQVWIPLDYLRKDLSARNEQKQLRAVRWQKKLPIKEDSMYYTFAHTNYQPYQSGLKQMKLFQKKALSKFVFQWVNSDTFETDSVFILDFQAKRLSYSYTQNFYAADFKGRIYIRIDDYAIVQLESACQTDTNTINGFSRKYYPSTKGYKEVFYAFLEERYRTCLLSFKKQVDGYYYINYRKDLIQEKGIDRRSGQTFSRWETLQAHLQSIITTQTAQPAPLPGKDIYLHEVRYEQGFWKKYQPIIQRKQPLE